MKKVECPECGHQDTDPLSTYTEVLLECGVVYASVCSSCFSSGVTVKNIVVEEGHGNAE